MDLVDDIADHLRKLGVGGGAMVWLALAAGRFPQGVVAKVAGKISRENAKGNLAKEKEEKREKSGLSAGRFSRA